MSKLKMVEITEQISYSKKLWHYFRNIKSLTFDLYLQNCLQRLDKIFFVFPLFAVAQTLLSDIKFNLVHLFKIFV